MSLGSTTSDAAVVRIRVDSASAWPAELPQVPDGHLVTVSTTSLADTAWSAALRSRGYVLVGVGRAPLAPGDDGVIDLVVPRALISSEPAWWARMVARAERVFVLALGPVARVFSAHTTAHEAAQGLARVR